MIEAAVKIIPFANMTSCPKCGEFDQTCQSDKNATPHPVRVLRSQYCPGGKEPEGEPTNPFGAMMDAVVGSGGAVDMRTIAGAVKPKINICAGIGEEHLHRICNNCGFEFLMRTLSHTGEKLVEILRESVLNGGAK